MNMFQVDIHPEVILEQQRALEAALSTNPDTEKALRKLIRKEIMTARANVASVAQSKLGKNPRNAHQAVRSSVYKKILGANINIYNSRKRHAPTQYEPPRKLDHNPHQRGGNRRPRSERTNTVMHYGPQDRGFILRFQNAGTANRSTIYGNRGSIQGKNFFRNATEAQLTQAADRLANLIDTELANILNKKKK